MLTSTLALMQGAAWAHADEAGWTECRAKADPIQRLACYDALAAPLGTGGTLRPEQGSAGAPMPRPSAVGPLPLVLSGQPRQTPEQFGQDARVGALEAIETRFTGTFEGWSPRDRIRLANGQVWQVVDDSNMAVYLQNPKVRIRRGALGAYFLEVEGLNKSARVKRLE